MDVEVGLGIRTGDASSPGLREIDPGQCAVTCTKVSDVPENPAHVPLPDFTRWPSFPFEGNMRIKTLAPPVAVEPPRSGEDASDCVACNTPDDSYIWVSERWRVRAMDRPTGLPMVLILECRSHLDLGDLPNLLAAELGVMTVRLERAIRSLDGVARVHVNRWGDGSAHLHMWFLARPYGRLQLRGTFLSLWDDILPTIPEQQWRENLALVAAWLGEFGGRAIAEPPHIQWQSPSTFSVSPMSSAPTQYESASHAGSPDATTAASAGASPNVGPGFGAGAQPSTESSPESSPDAHPDANPRTDAVAGGVLPEAGFDTDIGAGYTGRAGSVSFGDHANGSAPLTVRDDVPEEAAGATEPGGDADPMAGAGAPGVDQGATESGGPDTGNRPDAAGGAVAKGAEGQDSAGGQDNTAGDQDHTDGSKPDSADEPAAPRSGGIPRQGGENPKQNSVGV